MIVTAEYVSLGHPDRLCDAIVNNIVNYVVKKDKDALCGLECAVHTNKVFVDGRIAAGKTRTVINEEKIKEIVRQVYTDAGYGRSVYSNIEDGYIRMWHPFPEELEIILDVCIEKLSKDERDLRKYSDDQNVVNGYAINSPETDYLPLEHYVALKLGHNLASQYYERGPDFKILVQLDKNGDKYTWHRLTFSVQHSREDHFKDLYAKMFKRVNYELEQLFKFTKLDSLSNIERDKFFLNGAGVFIQGGPEGDNGLSGSYPYVI